MTTQKIKKPDFPTTIITPVFRLSYPNVWTSKFNQLAKREQFDIQMLFDKATAKTDLAPMIKLMQDLITFKWGTKPAGFLSPFKDGDLKVEKNPIYAGQIILGSWSRQAPGVRDPTGKHPITQHDEIYGGCWCRAQLNAYAYEKGQNQGVSFGLLHVQKVKDGDPFGTRTRAEDAFAPVESAGASAAADDLFS